MTAFQYAFLEISKMSKILIIKKADGGIVRIIPNAEKYGEDKKLLHQCKAASVYIQDGNTFFEMEQSDFPDKSKLESRCQLYHEGDSIKIDSAWERRVMPCQLIKSKEIKYQTALIDAELAKEAPDAVELVRAQRKIEQVKTMTDVETYEMAIENLARAEVAKPEIEAKLQEKVSTEKGKK